MMNWTMHTPKNTILHYNAPKSKMLVNVRLLRGYEDGTAVVAVVKTAEVIVVPIRQLELPEVTSSRRGPKKPILG